MSYGRHISISKGVIGCLDYCKEIHTTGFQFFLRSPKMLTCTQLSEQKLETFDQFKRQNVRKFKLKFVVHSPYVLNFCHPSSSNVYKQSVAILVDDLIGAHHLGAIGCVIHLGKNTKGLSFNEALDNYASGIVECLMKTQELDDTCIIIETGAGQGTETGWKLKNLGKIRDIIREKLRKQSERVREQNDNSLINRIKFCIDTCHIYSATYDIVNNCEFVGKLIQKYLDWENVVCVHVNDSKGECGCRVDRHADPNPCINKCDSDDDSNGDSDSDEENEKYSGKIGKNALTKFIEMCNEYNDNILYILETPSDEIDHSSQIKWLSKILR